MKKLYIIFLIVAAIIVVSFAIFNKNPYEQPVEEPPFITNHKDATYVIGDRFVTLVDGLSEVSSNIGSSTIITTKYYGNELRHDLNDDGNDDVVFVLTQETGGSGLYYYVVAALKTPTGYAGSQAYLLGDRIVPKSIEINEGTTTRGTTRQNVIVVNYLDRLPTEPFTSIPTVEKSVWIKLDPATMAFALVLKDEEGL